MLMAGLQDLLRWYLEIGIPHLFDGHLAIFVCFKHLLLGDRVLDHGATGVGNVVQLA